MPEALHSAKCPLKTPVGCANVCLEIEYLFIRLATDAVSEHAFAMTSALKRQVLPMHQMTVEGKKWTEVRAAHLVFGRPPRTNGEETLVGYVSVMRLT